MSFVEVRDLVKKYRRPGGDEVLAVDRISMDIERGDSMGVIGESGSGKSTLARLVLRLIDADSGSVVVDGVDVRALGGRELRRRRQHWQIVFQEPFASLNPRMKIEDIVGEPLVIHEPGLSHRERAMRVAGMLEEVGLSGDHLMRRPAHLSGGQQQRVGIARALITNPSFIVLDEPTASLDMTIRASVLATLAKLRQDRGLTYLLISHDITTVEAMCSHVAVMHRGVFVEYGEASDVINAPRAAYTKELMSARLTVDFGVGQARRELANARNTGKGTDA
ncbi:ATP-binding cassette domain-containing protein [Pseudarthrobacter sp. SSS035]|uniref:ATP-binding cassette domain-containing protein n=1 Tax=Pseudarthrobacter sp. SSS035 TaxID=2931399 RepID=UPI00200D095D|nr:ATP-binding cassette domain-containing protein [Pseudarthrobacter sp. SSS035]